MQTLPEMREHCFVVICLRLHVTVLESQQGICGREINKAVNTIVSVLWGVQRRVGPTDRSPNRLTDRVTYRVATKNLIKQKVGKGRMRQKMAEKQVASPIYVNRFSYEGLYSIFLK